MICQTFENNYFPLNPHIFITAERRRGRRRSWDANSMIASCRILSRSDGSHRFSDIRSLPREESHWKRLVINVEAYSIVSIPIGEHQICTFVSSTWRHQTRIVYGQKQRGVTINNTYLSDFGESVESPTPPVAPNWFPIAKRLKYSMQTLSDWFSQLKSIWQEWRALWTRNATLWSTRCTSRWNKRIAQGEETPL